MRNYAQLPRAKNNHAESYISTNNAGDIILQISIDKWKYWKYRQQPLNKHTEHTETPAGFTMGHDVDVKGQSKS